MLLAILFLVISYSEYPMFLCLTKNLETESPSESAFIFNAECGAMNAAFVAMKLGAK